MKILFLIQLLTTLILSVALLFLKDKIAGLSFFLGSFFILLNLLALSWIWKNIFQKKLIALSVSAIVFKYAILGVIIYQVVRSPEINVLWFGLGISTLIISSLVYSIFFFKEQPENEEIEVAK